VVLELWLRYGESLGRMGFYALFAVTVTISVQLVGLYLVFATLIVPPLATRRMRSRQLAAAWGVGVAGYAVGLAASTALDWPSGPVIVWTLCIVGLAAYALHASASRRHQP
jgi:zinc/manganese transport system permease protein